MSKRHPCPSERFPLTRASRKSPKREYKSFIDLPQFHGTVTNNSIRTHLPEFYGRARQLGNRNIQPMGHLGHLISNFSQVSDYELAANWIFLRVAYFQPRQCQYHPPPPIPMNQDPIEILLQEVTNQSMVGTDAGADVYLTEALKIFWTVGNLLQSGEFGHSYQMLDSYFQTALGFVAPMISSMVDAGPMYYLLGGIALASDHNPQLVKNVLMLFPLEFRVAFEIWLYPLAQMGDTMAYALFYLM